MTNSPNLLPNHAAYGATVRFRRNLLGISQQALAADLGVSWSAISAVERGTYLPGVSWAEALEKKLDLGVNPLDDPEVRQQLIELVEAAINTKSSSSRIQLLKQIAFLLGLGQKKEDA